LSKATYKKRLDKLSVRTGSFEGEPLMTKRQVIELFSDFVSDGIISAETLAAIRPAWEQAAKTPAPAWAKDKPEVWAVTAAFLRLMPVSIPLASVP